MIQQLGHYIAIVGGTGSIPGQVTKILHGLWPKRI